MMVSFKENFDITDIYIAQSGILATPVRSIDGQTDGRRRNEQRRTT